ncbi:MAG: mannose-6-phosphate isomerase, class I [Spirochaetota bacterium]
MRNGIQHYAWGSTTDIPRLTGIPNPDDEPMAELWMGDHPRLPSRLWSGPPGNGGPPSGIREQGLGAFLETYPRFALGETVRERFGTRLPFLFKLLSAAKGLSIQVHPSRSQAVEGYEREEAAGVPLDAPYRNYKDRNHKPEILLAVTPFWALSGFRKPEEIVEDFRGIEGPGDLVSRLENGDLESFYRTLMAPTADTAAAGGESGSSGILRRVLEYARTRVGDGGRVSSPEAPVPGPDCRFSWVLELNRQFPEDLGALAPLYLNCLYLVPGEALFLESGLLHAYLRGTGIELMANSDNVLRGGCTVKHVDLPELLRIVRFEATENPRFPGVRRELPGAVVTTFAPPVEEFALQKLEIAGGYTFEKGNTPAILFGLRGEIDCRGTAGDSAGNPAAGRSVDPPRAFPGEESVTLAPGESVFVPAAVGGLTLSGSGEAYLASA